MTHIKTVSGRNRRVPAHVDINTIVGLDPAGRIVVSEDWMGGKYVFALTLCCSAFDKGTEHGVVCRHCYGDEAGDYLFAAKDGSFPELDPLASLAVPH